MSPIVTGYEKTLDWPLYEGRPKPYLLATTPRSGSTFLSHLLWRTGCLGAPLEYLNFEATGPFGSASGSPDRQAAVWEHVVAHRTSPNGIFGMKAFPLQMEVLGSQNPSLLTRTMRFLLGKGPDSLVVQLRRRDEIAHAISLARASLSGIWRAEQERGEDSDPIYSAHMVKRARRELAAQDEAWAQMCREMGITPLVLWYEDVVASPTDAVAAVADYLSVALDPAAEIEVPRIRQQSQSGAREWRQRYERGSD